MTGTVV